MAKCKIMSEQRPIKQRVDMCEMKPGQVGVIVDKKYLGEIVMRTLSDKSFEVMSLSKFEPLRCWIDRYNDLQVELLEEPLTVQFSN